MVAKAIIESEIVIGSHAVYRRMLDGSAKTRIFPCAHPDEVKNYRRAYVLSLNFEVLDVVFAA